MPRSCTGTTVKASTVKGWKLLANTCTGAFDVIWKDLPLSSVLAAGTRPRPVSTVRMPEAGIATGAAPAMVTIVPAAPATWTSRRPEAELLGLNITQNSWAASVGAGHST